jgi:hypothetical protein
MCVIARPYLVRYTPISVFASAKLIGYGVAIFEQSSQRIPTIVPTHAPIVTPTRSLVIQNVHGKER